MGVGIYGDHLETPEGSLVPAPGGCHPALEEVREELLASDAHELTLWIGDSMKHFRRGIVGAVDGSGRQWIWAIWVDELGRGLGGQAVLV